MPTNRSSLTLLAGLALIALGALFLLQQFFNVPLFGQVWPLVVLAAGALMFAMVRSGGQAAGPLAVPAGVVTALGLILLVLNLTGHWQAWAYAWPLLLAGAGAGLGGYGRPTNRWGFERLGGALLRFGLGLFLLFGLLFELFIFGTEQTARWAAPAALIILGAYLLLRGLGIFGRRRAVRGRPASEVTLEGGTKGDTER
jgi:hypothetical protein